MKGLLCFFYSIDKNIWGDNINTNRYYATICLYFVAIMGALQGGGSILNSWFGWNTDMNLNSNLGLVAVIVGLNLFESIAASGAVKTAVLRSFLVFVVFPLAFALGYALAVVVMVAIAAIIVIYLVGSLLLGGGSPKRGVVTDEYGNRTKVEKNMLGDYQDKWGNTYSDNHDGTVTKND